MRTRKDPKSEFTSFFNFRSDGTVKAPGRVCMIGEHTDYNQGFVLPFALDLVTTVTFRVRDDTRVRVRSVKYPEYQDSFDVTGAVEYCPRPWANYIRGVFYTVRDYGFDLRRGMDLLIGGTLPQDAGLGSSGAMSTAVAGAIRKAFNFPLDKRSLALIAEKAENDFLGKHCGIMDPLTATVAKEGHLVLIDCEDYSIRQTPFPEELVVVIFDSRVERKLVGNEFNELRSACERAAQTMAVQSLRHATPEMLEQYRTRMDSSQYRCAYHVITENARTRQLVKAFISDDFKAACRLMSESHDSLKNNFSNTTPEIDTLVDLCRQELKGEVGARMTGGGFGGSVIALCRQAHAQNLIRNVSRGYFERYGVNLPVHRCRPAEGIRIRWDKQVGAEA